MAATRTFRPGSAAVVVLLAVVGGCTSGPTPPPPTPASTPTASTALPPVSCTTSVRTGPLPVWARDGFTGDGSSFRHVEGLGGAVVGVVFGYPLTSPPRPSRANKILWVTSEPTSGRLAVEARLAGTGPVVRREVGFGGGQSIIDLPAPGCWRLTLRWGDHLTDTVDLPYASR